MRTFTQKPVTTQQTTSAKPVASSRSLLEKNPDSHSVMNPQRTTGDQVVQRRLEKDRRNVEGNSRFGHDFSRISIHGPPAGNRESAPTPAARALPRTGSAGAEHVTGMPSPLRAGLEALSGFDLSGTRVHRNSPRPAQVNALAYTQGQDIHLGPGQDEHLAHEGWHVVQQKQGRVRRTTQAEGVAINDDAGLEQEADQMASRVASHGSSGPSDPLPASPGNAHGSGVAQRKIQITGLDEARRKKFAAKINEGSVLKFKMDATGFLERVDPSKKSIEVYSNEIAAAVADPQTIKLNLVSKDDTIFVDSFAGGEVDYDDMVSMPFNLFRINFLHFVVERLAIPSYEANKATASPDDFKTAHGKALDAEERQLKEWFPKKTIKFVSAGFDATTRVVDAAGNGSIDYVYDFTDVKQVYKQPIIAGETKENIIRGKIVVVR